MSSLRGRIKDFLRDIWTLYYICRDPRMPAHAKALAVGIVVYALSPVDLLPDVIPALGFLDDLLVVPAGLFLVRQLIPAASLAQHRGRADRVLARLSSLVVVFGIAVIWVLGIVAAAIYLL